MAINLLLLLISYLSQPNDVELNFGHFPIGKQMHIMLAPLSSAYESYQPFISSILEKGIQQFPWNSIMNMYICTVKIIRSFNILKMNIIPRIIFLINII